MTDADASKTAGRLAAVAAAFMIANQVAGKAIRDALFLSTFPVERLPAMLTAASIVSLLVVVAASRVLATRPPAKVVPPAFLASAGLLVVEALLFRVAPGAGAVLLFLHMAAFGGVLISWFWSLINERFDPRTARARIASIAGGGTLGGYLGGVAAALAGDHLSSTALVLALASAHAVTFAVLRGLARGVPDAAPAALPVLPALLEGPRTVMADGYLRTIASIVLLCTMAAAGVDYVFKVRAVETWGESDALLRFFAVYYTGLSLLTFLLQATLSRRLLERVGVVGTASALPIVLTALPALALAVPSLAAAVLARAGEASIQSSWYRSAYELFFVPVAEAKKRVAKLWIDVGADRLGDAIAGAAIAIVVVVVPEDRIETVALASAVVLGAMAAQRLRSLQRRYVGTLAKALVRRADDLDLPANEEAGPYTILLSRSGLPTAPRDATAPHIPAVSAPDDLPDETPEASLASADPARVRRTLASHRPMPAAWAETVVSLLAWDAVYVEALEALRSHPEGARDALLRALADPEEVFAVRRRAPRALSVSGTPDVLAGLTDALSDRRFEVRYQAGQAIWRIVQRDPSLRPPDRALVPRIVAELAVEAQVWASHRLLDDHEDRRSDLVGEVLERRVNRSVEHVFTLLALTYDPQAMRLAYRSLDAEDAHLRGTALEFLEGTLPAKIHKPLLAFVEAPARSGERRPVSAVLADLVAANRSIALALGDPDSAD